MLMSFYAHFNILVASEEETEQPDWEGTCHRHVDGCGQVVVVVVFKVYLCWERERAGEEQRERDRERERIPSRLHTVSAEPDAGLKPMNHEITTWAEVKSQTLNWMSHPGTPVAVKFQCLALGREVGAQAFPLPYKLRNLHMHDKHSLECIKYTLKYF